MRWRKLKKIVVIGGGITGLSAMYHLHKQIIDKGLDLELALIEGEERLGGKIRTVEEGGFIMESGADSIVARKPNVAPFIQELGMEDEAVYNASGISYIYTEEGLKAIPAEALFGIPMTVESLAKTELVSAEGKVAALRDLYIENDRFTKDDSVGEFLEEFLGKEFVEKQISPVLSGVYSGNLYDLTIASTLPYLLDYKNEYGSIIKGLSANREKYLSRGDKKFLSFKNGLSGMIHQMEEQLSGAALYKGVKAAGMKRSGAGYLLSLDNGEQIEADCVVLAVPHTAAQELLQDEGLNEEFDQLKNSSLISVYLGFDIPDSRLPADGTGFITAKDSGLACDACTWTSKKWAHTSPEGRLLVRLFYKSSGPVYEEYVRLPEEELVRKALEDVKAGLGLDIEPVTAEVTKWNKNMPNYHIEHHHLVRSLERKLEDAYPNVLLAGCSYYGVGIPDCIENGRETADAILAALGN